MFQDLNMDRMVPSAPAHVSQKGEAIDGVDDVSGGGSNSGPKATILGSANPETGMNTDDLVICGTILDIVVDMMSLSDASEKRVDRHSDDPQIELC
ncbi:uncharacterized protein N7469_011339 [Penicillium citrinum]|uniref:Uncharacterized protein n=1 Tax=Penicillium citrinum TaxID=5077 RepID=A0A9W9TCT3_PENCI|nr:uncharacterized protein N7469_011339 [Penicillium citrinum]KAJ5217714.1 hypothetical protein N7469_011339 [Penicillium citrinum]